MHTSTPAGMGSMKSQFKRADASGARFALIFGSDEVTAQHVTIKSLRDVTAKQVTQPLAALSLWAPTLQSSL
jgi:histidyl-tRNA synthetase